jgi:hypothetical protein
MRSVTTSKPRYEHTQRGRLHYLLFAAALTPLAMGLAVGRGGPGAWYGFVALTAVLAVIAFCFARLTVRDEGTHLMLRYGPLPLFRKRIAYAEMEAATPSRSRMIDGLGVHWMPGRGWTYNLWGFDCVKIDRPGKSSLRVGTDQPRELAEFLGRRIGRR